MHAMKFAKKNYPQNELQAVWFNTKTSQRELILKLEVVYMSEKWGLSAFLSFDYFLHNQSCKKLTVCPKSWQPPVNHPSGQLKTNPGERVLRTM